MHEILEELLKGRNTLEGDIKIVPFTPKLGATHPSDLYYRVERYNDTTKSWHTHCIATSTQEVHDFLWMDYHPIHPMRPLDFMGDWEYRLNDPHWATFGQWLIQYYTPYAEILPERAFNKIIIFLNTDPTLLEAAVQTIGFLLTCKNGKDEEIYRDFRDLLNDYIDTFYVNENQ